MSREAFTSSGPASSVMGNWETLIDILLPRKKWYGKSTEISASTAEYFDEKKCEKD